MSAEYCSCTVPHPAHTYGGRLMIYCPGIPKPEPECHCVIGAFSRVTYVDRDSKDCAVHRERDPKPSQSDRK